MIAVLEGRPWGQSGVTELVVLVQDDGTPYGTLPTADVG